MGFWWREGGEYTRGWYVRKMVGAYIGVTSTQHEFITLVKLNHLITPGNT